MHGLIMSELRDYAQNRIGIDGWAKVSREAGVPGAVHLVSATHPDEEATVLGGAASRITRFPPQTELEDFGAFLVPSLLKIYRASVRPEWRTLDLLEHTEPSMHKAVHLRDPAAAPPRLQVSRISATEVLIRYGSPRRLCGVVKGLIRGIAAHYDEAVTIHESACMHRKAPECLLTIRRETGRP